MTEFARDHDSAHEHEVVLEEELLLDERASDRDEPRRASIGQLAPERERVRVGDVLAGKYRVERVHVSGAHGLTVAAKHLQLGQRYALKIFFADPQFRAESAARVRREARLLAKLRNPHIPRVIDLVSLDFGAFGVVTEHLSGTDLRGVLRVREWLPVSEAIDYVLQACEALAEAQLAGVAHANLKLSNLFLARESDGRTLIKVLDFGGAERLIQLQLFGPSAMTRGAVNSYAYLAPEQLRDPSTVDSRVDIWALGAILHELLTGRAVYAATRLPGLFATIAADAPMPATQLRPEIPAELELIILRCLEKQPNYRFAGVGELARQLRPFASVRGRESVDLVVKTLKRGAPSSRSILPPAPRASVPPPLPVPRSAAPDLERGRRWVEMGVLALGVLGCSSAIGAYLSIRSLQAVLVARAAERPVIAGLSPALAAAPVLDEATHAPSGATSVSVATSATSVLAPPLVLSRPVAGQLPAKRRPKAVSDLKPTPYDDDFFEAPAPPSAGSARASLSGPLLFDEAN